MSCAHWRGGGSFFGNNTLCVVCINQCNNCTSATYCLSCITSFSLNPDHTCLSTCPSGYVSVASVCTTCTSNCVTCSNTPSNCTSCSNPYFLTGNNCVQTTNAQITEPSTFLVVVISTFTNAGCAGGSAFFNTGQKYYNYLKSFTGR